MTTIFEKMLNMPVKVFFIDGNTDSGTLEDYNEVSYKKDGLRLKVEFILLKNKPHKNGAFYRHIIPMHSIRNIVMECVE